MAEVVAPSTAAELSTVEAEDFIAEVVEVFTAAAPIAVRALLAEEVILEAAIFVVDQPRVATEWAVARTGGSAHRAA